MAQESEGRYVFAVRPQEGENFWDVNPELEVLAPYAEFKKDLGKRRSGNIMEAVWIAYDPKSSAVIADRKAIDIQKDLSENLLKNIPHDWKDPLLKKVIRAYQEDCRTYWEKELAYWESELRQRRLYAAELPWDTEREEKDKLLSTQKKLWDSYEDVLKKFQQEQSEKLHGGATKSIIEDFGTT